jgi:hypothetical protein
VTDLKMYINNFEKVVSAEALTGSWRDNPHASGDVKDAR